MFRRESLDFDMQITLVLREKYTDCVVLVLKPDISCQFQRVMAEWPTIKLTGLRHIAVEHKTRSQSSC